MSHPIRNWQAVKNEVLRRIHERTWAPGDLIPTETELAEEFGCARVTVNRALRTLADAGLLDRRRKAGTRVATHPVRKVTLNIPVIRLDIEDKGQTYSHTIVKREEKIPDAATRADMKLSRGKKALHLATLHKADDCPHALEDRWINLASIPTAKHVDFTTISANEWLVLNAPFTHGDIAFSARTATDHAITHLDAKSGDALFQMDRLTWDKTQSVTKVCMIFAPDYRMKTIV